MVVFGCVVGDVWVYWFRVCLEWLVVSLGVCWLWLVWWV